MTTLWGCVHCGDFTVPDSGMRFESVPDAEGGAWRLKVTHPLWELEMVRHWRDAHPERLAEVGAALATTITDEWVIEEMRRSSQAALDRMASQFTADAFTTRPWSGRPPS